MGYQRSKPATNSAIYLGKSHKEKGNAHFKKGFWTDAIEEYRDAIMMLERDNVDSAKAEVRAPASRGCEWSEGE